MKSTKKKERNSSEEEINNLMSEAPELLRSNSEINTVAQEAAWSMVFVALRRDAGIPSGWRVKT